MRFAVFDEHRIGIVDEPIVRDITGCFESWEPASQGVNRVIAEWPSAVERVVAALSSGQATEHLLADISLLPPVPAPAHVFGAPVNYRSHQGEVKVYGSDPHHADASTRGFFVLTPSSITGPAGSIELPDLPGDREFDYEGEVAIVIGRGGRSVPPEQAWDHVFGITGFIDVTLRQDELHQEERSMRKSYSTFNPIGPYIRVVDEPLDPSRVEIELRLNGDLRQRATLESLIVDIPQLVAAASKMVPLEPGDVFATGTPAGVGRIAVGDRVELAVSGVGVLSIDVTRRSW